MYLLHPPPERLLTLCECVWVLTWTFITFVFGHRAKNQQNTSSSKCNLLFLCIVFFITKITYKELCSSWCHIVYHTYKVYCYRVVSLFTIHNYYFPSSLHGIGLVQVINSLFFEKPRNKKYIDSCKTAIIRIKHRVYFKVIIQVLFFKNVRSKFITLLCCS